jgi:hypothetical protein
MVNDSASGQAIRQFCYHPEGTRDRTRAMLGKAVLLFVFLGTIATPGSCQEIQSVNAEPLHYLETNVNLPAPKIQSSTRIEFARRKKRSFDKAFWGLWIAAVAVAAADAGLTQACLHRPNCSETNPLFGHRPSPWLLYSAKFGGLGFAFVISRNQRRSGSKLSLVAPIVALASGTAATINNSIVLSHLPSLSGKYHTRTAPLSYLSSYSGRWNCPTCITTPCINNRVEAAFGFPALTSTDRRSSLLAHQIKMCWEQQHFD